MGKNRSGAAAKDITLKLPVGTQILDIDQKTILADLTQKGDRVLLAKGGQGGAGNLRFKSSVHQTPRKAMPGFPGEERWLWLRLKLLADIGLVGLPNAGKSSLISALTNARPKIAPYPFTTLYPCLGVLELPDNRRRILADIPGLIKGASDGEGLGSRFLGHVERTQTILHIIDASEKNPVHNYHLIRSELKCYGSGLEKKEEIITLNKADLVDRKTVTRHAHQLQAETGKEIMIVSALSRQGFESFIQKIDKTTQTEEESVYIADGSDQTLSWSP